MYKWGDESRHESHMAIYPAVLIRAIGFPGRVDDLSSQRCLSKSGSKFVASGASTAAGGGDSLIGAFPNGWTWFNGHLTALSFVLFVCSSFVCVFIKQHSFKAVCHSMCTTFVLGWSPVQPCAACSTGFARGFVWKMPPKKKSNDLKPAFPLWKCPYIFWGGHPTVSRKLDKLLCHWKPLLSLAFLWFCDQNLIEEMRPWHSWQLWREAMGAWKRTILDPCILCIYNHYIILYYIILYYILHYILYYISYHISYYIYIYLCVWLCVCWDHLWPFHLILRFYLELRMNLVRT